MAIVDVNIVRAKNHAQLLNQTVASRLDTEGLKNFDDMITRGSCSIHTLDRVDTREVDSIGFDDPTFFDNLRLTCDFIVHDSLTVCCTARVEDF